jgi:hypothetical protein
VSLEPGDVTVVREFLGRCYGAPTEEGARARRLALELEGIQLEDTYTAKCLAAVLQLAGVNRIATGPFCSGIRTAVYPAECHLPNFHALPAAFHQFFADRTAEEALH